MVSSISRPAQTFFEPVKAFTSEKGWKLRGKTVDEVAGKRCRCGAEVWTNESDTFSL